MVQHWVQPIFFTLQKPLVFKRKTRFAAREKVYSPPNSTTHNSPNCSTLPNFKSGTLSAGIVIIADTSGWARLI